MPKRQQKRKSSEDQLQVNQTTVPALPEMLEATTNLGRGAIEVPKEIKEIEALIFSRGKLNAQFFRGRKDLYVVPSWVDRMLRHDSPGVISLGHSSWFINSNYRNWVMFGGLDCISEGIVTDKGLVVPIIDGFGLLMGVVIENKPRYISRDGETKQSLKEGYLPIVENKWVIEGKKYEQIVYGDKVNSSEIGVLHLTKQTDDENNIILSIRPFNQDGVSLINSIEFQPKDQTVVINKKLALKLGQKPEKIAVANYALGGDSAIKLADLAMPYTDKGVSISCPVGLANMTFVFHKDELKIETYFRMNNESFEVLPKSDIIENSWKEKLALGLSLKTGNKEMDRLYWASLVNLLLLVDPGTVTPGPTEYHRFWCRDAAFLINALDKAGYNTYAREALNQFILRQRPNGFYYSHEGEFDSNGEGIWAMAEHAKLTGDYTWLESMFESIELAAKWLISTRKLEKPEALAGKEGLVSGLLPPGFSAEHLGPCDYFYWDNFWGVAGLREAAHIARILQKESAGYLQNEFQRYLLDLFASTAKLSDLYGYLPVGPYRESDSAMIANLCAFHPTRIWDSSNEILRKTADEIYEKYTHKGGFFHGVAWNCYGTYLTMHLAQVYHDANEQEKTTEILNWLLKNQSCSQGWAEGISPQTMKGGMGDSPHGWASADWILLLRNLFCTETLDGSVKLLSGFPVKNLRKGVEAKRLNTYYGVIDFTAKLTRKKLTLKIKNKFNLKSFKIKTPYAPYKISADKGDAFKVSEDCIEVSSHAKKVIIEFE